MIPLTEQIDTLLARHADGLPTGITDEIRDHLVAGLELAPLPIALEYLNAEGVCRICGGTRQVDTRGLTTPQGEPCGIVAPCLCASLPPDAKGVESAVSGLISITDALLAPYLADIDPVILQPLRFDLARIVDFRQFLAWEQFSSGLYCGLCGNRGRIFQHDDLFCICPNGRRAQLYLNPPSYPPTVLTTSHPGWPAFAEALSDALSVTLPGGDDIMTWACDHQGVPHATRILLDTPGVDVAASLLYYHERGGHCDCEILINVLGSLPDNEDEDGDLPVPPLGEGN